MALPKPWDLVLDLQGADGNRLEELTDLLMTSIVDTLRHNGWYVPVGSVRWWFRQDPSGATINRTLVTTYTEDLSYGIFNGGQGVWQSSGFQNVHVGWHCQLLEERRSDPKIRSLEDRCLTPGEAAFVREHQRPAVSDYDRTLVILGSTYDNRAMASIKEIEELEAAAKIRERTLAAEARDMKALTDLARAGWGPQ